MTRIIKVDQKSAAKVAFFLFALIGTIVYVMGFFFLIRIGHLSGAPLSEKLIYLIIVLILAPLTQGSFFGLLGLFFAWFYNITCRYTGGFMVETKDS
jgi:hypothetical protein